jgi:hypothetical protein
MTTTNKHSWCVTATWMSVYNTGVFESRSDFEWVVNYRSSKYSFCCIVCLGVCMVTLVTRWSFNFAFHQYDRHDCFRKVNQFSLCCEQFYSIARNVYSNPRTTIFRF